MIFNSDLFPDDLSPTKTAFSLAREKLDISFFIDFFHFTIRLFYWGKNRIKKWKGFRLLAADGMAVRVPDTPENRFFIGVHENQHGAVAAVKILAVHDLLNRIFVKIIPHPRAVAELVALHWNFDAIPDDAITIYDRHYADSLLLDRHLKSGKPCVIRMKTKGNKVVEQFLESGETDAICEFRIGERAYYSARDRYGLKNRHPRFSTFKVRLVRVELSTGETEVLATNLFDKKKFPTECFGELYAKRWGIETAFDEIKNQLKLAIFSGYKTNFVLQDLWSVFIYYNIRALFITDAENKLREPENTKKINRNIAVAILQKYWRDLFAFDLVRSLPAKTSRLMARYTEKARIRPPTPRKRKQMRANERHMTEKNYKPAF